jgi:hypothetical protein
MASQIAHIIYAKRYFDQLEAGKVKSSGKIEKDEFILGCTFPDIRRIDGIIKRKDTHLKFEPLNLDFSNLSPFEAGWKFHLYCDMRREEILNGEKFYSLPNTTDFYNQPAKILEDEIIYGKFNNWEKLNGYFNNPPYIDAGIGVNGETYKLWYAILAKYIERQPDERSERAFLLKQPGLTDKIGGIMDSVSKLRQNKKVIMALNKVWEEIV